MSAFQKLETQPLCRKVMDFLQSLPADTEVEEEQPEVDFKWDTYHKNTLEQAQLSEDDDDWDDEDDDHPNIVYTNE
jgi:GTP-binding protein